MTNQQKRREMARQIHNERRCSHCGNRITLFEAFCMIFGDGIDSGIIVEFDSGGRGVIFSSQFCPQTMNLIEDEDSKDRDDEVLTTIETQQVAATGVK
jgi:hypothetical protein